MQKRTGGLARAHLFPAPIPDRLMGGREAAVLIRYDGKSSEDEQIVFAVFLVSDLAKLPAGRLPADEALIDGETAFFLETPNGVALYVETDTHSDALLAFRGMAETGEAVLYDSIGDLAHMGAPGEIRAPARAAFEVNEFPEVPVHAGLNLLRELRLERSGPEIADEDPAISPGL
ncbi:hypothetical protein [Defluviimonas salinarum]|uniref:SseB protein N-terminal domain-containing protein n=1 Tax=Defluviimonas salinarum TaxID=2992147 RepID=A0ABT3JAD3_9RHOB|nr:hypothetical protein [Defluviimonas salinarum]MCW3784655.1 hypothetical protein [Defluviimonas salinarum]